ncbi:MAG: methyltransferase [bacterium]
MNSRISDWGEVTRHFTNYFAAVSVLAAMQLDLFTRLRNGPRTYEELASDLGVDLRRLRMLLTTLATNTGLVTINDDRVSNSPLAMEFLVNGEPKYMGGTHEIYSRLFEAVLPTAESIRTGTPQSERDWDSLPDDKLRSTLRGLNAGAMGQARMIAQEYNFGRFESILDVGGGGGGFAIGACQVCPTLGAQVVELPRIARIAQDFVEAAGLTSRIKAVTHDIVASPLHETYPAAVLRNLLQVMSAERAQRVVENVASSIRPDGEIFVIGQMLDDDLLGPPGALGVNLVFLNVYRDGEAYTESSYRAWLAHAGFVDLQRGVLPGGLGHSLIRGRRGGSS